MAALTINDVAVTPSSAVIEAGTLGEATDKCKAVYFNISDSKWYKMDCSGTAVQSGKDGAGMTLNKGQADDEVQILRDGLAVIDAAANQGGTYVGGGTAAGDINPDADADTNNWRKTVLFVAKTATGVGTNTEILFRPIVSEVTA